MKKSTKITLIIAGALIVAGIIISIAAMLVTGFDFERFSTGGTAERIEKTFAAGEISDIDFEISVHDLDVVPSQDGMIHVVYYKYSNEHYDLEQDGDTLSLDTDVDFFSPRDLFRFDFSFDERRAQLSLPADYSGKLELESSTGAVVMSGMECIRELSLESSTGSISCKNVSVTGDVEISASTGAIKCETLTSGRNISVRASTGNITLKEISSGEITVKSTTGDISVDSVSSNEADLKATTGDIRIDGLDSKKVTLKTSTGSINGTLAGAKDEYNVTSHTSTGSCNLPENWGSGTRILNASSSTGNIKISFAE